MTKKNQIKLLIIDDERELLDSLKLILELNGFYVTLCNNVEQAFVALKHTQYDLVLTDIEMPVKTGIDLIVTLREGMDLTIPIVIMTGRAKIEYLVEAIRYGASDFIAKPIVGSTLIELIHRQINKTKVKNLDFNLAHSIFEFTKSYIFYPDDYFHHSITAFLNSEIQKNCFINPHKQNDICLILEEAISNAFLHGIWRLTAIERLLDKEALMKVTEQKKLERGDNRAFVRVDVQYSVLSETEQIVSTTNQEWVNNKSPLQYTMVITISDTGSGFDWQRYMDDDLSFEHNATTGRGLFMIKALSDEIAFSQNGAQIKIKINV